MKILTILTALIIGGFAHNAHAGTYEASFDCSKAAAPIEKIICSADSLKTQDKQLNELFSTYKKMQSSDTEMTVVQNQRQWLIDRLLICHIPAKGEITAFTIRTKTQCVAGIYNNRISLLEAWIANGGKPSISTAKLETIIQKRKQKDTLFKQCSQQYDKEYKNCLDNCSSIIGEHDTKEKHALWEECINKQKCTETHNDALNQCVYKNNPQYDLYKKCEDKQSQEEKKADIECHSKCSGMQLSTAKMESSQIQSQSTKTLEKLVVQCLIENKCSPCALKHLSEYQQ